MLPDPAKSVSAAARWLSVTPDAARPHPVLPHIQREFSLSAVQAIKAIREANELRKAGGR